MYQHTRFNNKNNIFQKVGNLDYVLLSCLLILGFISLATMYSTDGGEILFHTRSHFIKFVIFFSMMIVVSFINIKFWFSLGYLSKLSSKYLQSIKAWKAINLFIIIFMSTLALFVLKDILNFI